MRPRRLALIGARGYVGAELIRLLDGHPGIELSAVSSRSLAGQRLADHVEGVGTDLAYADLTPDDVGASDAELWVLALPNGLSAPWVEALDRRAGPVRVVDVSTDHRFDPGWAYGLVERGRAALEGASRIANPGCYATGAQLALGPLLGLLEGPAQVFGVSGYSGAGTRPSERNDPEVLRDNLLPYRLAGHAHELEVRHHLGHPVFFCPHVAPFFRGITLTVSVALRLPLSEAELAERFHEAYEGERLVRVVDGTPRVRDVAGRHHVELGGLTLGDGGRHAVVVATLDNLLKGAATQALQNLNLACGFEELLGIEAWLD